MASTSGMCLWINSNKGKMCGDKKLLQQCQMYKGGMENKHCQTHKLYYTVHIYVVNLPITAFRVI